MKDNYDFSKGTRGTSGSTDGSRIGTRRRRGGSAQAQLWGGQGGGGDVEVIGFGPVGSLNGAQNRQAGPEKCETCVQR
jgi:hypothetical protein